MKLKTLKDIEWGLGSKETLENIKAEAIKWVKDCKNPVDFTRNDRCGHNLKEYCCCCQRTIEMNNITEEDLK